MTLAQITVLAELLAAVGAIASLMFVAFEIRKNTAQTLMAAPGRKQLSRLGLGQRFLTTAS
jgi:hypothetical protein